jgi:hypothetical protein
MPNCESEPNRESDAPNGCMWLGILRPNERLPVSAELQYTKDSTSQLFNKNISKEKCRAPKGILSIVRSPTFTHASKNAIYSEMADSRNRRPVPPRPQLPAGWTLHWSVQYWLWCDVFSRFNPKLSRMGMKISDTALSIC